MSLRMMLVLILAVVHPLMVVDALADDPGSGDPATEQELQPPSDSELSRLMNDYLERLARFDYHGAALVARDRQVLLNHAFGYAQVENGVFNHTTTLFSTGSATKQFTAAAIIYLEMQGKLSTADSIGKFLADVPDDKQAITIHHLLTHTSGFRPSLGRDEEPIPRDELMRLMLDNPLDYPVGDHYEYSNAGYSMLAAIVEIISGMGYEQFLQENLFRPSGMRHTGLKLLDVPDSLISHSHNQMLGYPSPADRPDDCWHLLGNGGILSTTGDMYRWYQALHQGDLFSATARQKLFTPYVREYEDGESFYGYGWVIDHYGDSADLIWHNGGAMPHGWSCADYYFVDDSTFMIVFANKPMSGAMPVDAIIEDLAQLMLGIEFDMPPQVISLAAEQLDQFNGEYTSVSGSSFEVSRLDDGLLVTGDGQSALDILFPSPFASRLPKYNDRTDTLVNLLAKGDYEATAGFFDDRMAAPEEWKAMSEQWWSAFDSLGGYQGVEIIGTRVSEGAQTYCRISFAGGSVVCRFFWMGGRCGGIVSEVELPGLTILSQTTNRFVSFNLITGSTVAVEFGDDGSLTVSSNGNSLTAQQ